MRISDTQNGVFAVLRVNPVHTHTILWYTRTSYNLKTYKNVRIEWINKMRAANYNTFPLLVQFQAYVSLFIARYYWKP